MRGLGILLVYRGVQERLIDKLALELVLEGFC